MQNHHTNNGTGAPLNTNGKELNAKQKAVLDIAQTYKTKKGGIDWKRAWKERPDYQRLLRYTAKDTKNQQAYNIGFELRRKGLIGETPFSRNGGRKKTRKQSRNGTHALELLQHAGGEPPTTIDVGGDQPRLLTEKELESLILRRVAQGVAAVLNEVGYCPRCGKDVKIHTMLELSRKH